MNHNAGILERVLQWQPGPNAEIIYCTQVHDGAGNGSANHWAIRLNDFPQQPLYTLLLNGQPVLDFDDWPAAWQRPPAK